MDEANDAAVKEQPAAAGSALAVARNQSVASALQALVPQSVGEAITLCTTLSKSTAIPKALRGKPESILTVVMAGLELGLTPIRAIQSITNISGSLCMKADLQLALVRRSGLLAYYAEGFEEHGVTDHDGRLGRKLDAQRCPDADKVAGLVLDLVELVPKGKPYGWTVAKRKGDDQLTVRTFSWLDAERAFVYERDEDETGSTKPERKKLSEKFNYQAWPQSMYPRRSRGQVLQAVFSDVLAGMPSVEALEGGQVIDLSPDDYSSGTDADQILADFRNRDAEATEGIELAFDNLALAPGRRLQLLTQYREDPRALWLHLRDEYSRRQGKPQAPPPKPRGRAKAAPAAAPDVVVTAQAEPPADQKPADQAPAAAQPPAQESAATQALFSAGFEAPNGQTTQPAELTKQPEPAAPAAAEPTKKPSVSELAARFKTGMASF